MNLISLAEKLSGEQQAPLVYDAVRCLHRGDKLAHCHACIEACPSEAIQAGRPPQFQVDACERCLACLPLCPTGAFAAEDELPRLSSCLQRLDVETLEVVCQQHKTPSLGLAGKTAAIQVRGCLAGLGTASYLQLATTSLMRVVVRTDACAACSWQTLPEQVRRQIDQAQTWLQAWQRADFVQELPSLDEPVKRPVHRADAPPMSRRDLFRGKVQEPPPIDVTSSLNPFHQRLRTINALQQLPRDAFDLSAAAPCEAGFASPIVDQSCSACGTCVRACPSGALALEQDGDEGHFQLTFALQACLACDVCAHLCPEQALTVRHEATLGQILSAPVETILFEGIVERCRRCNGSFAAHSMNDGLCSVCAFRLDNPFASRMPATLFAADASSRSGQTDVGEEI